jgi:hypothetical protein
VQVRCVPSAANVYKSKESIGNHNDLPVLIKRNLLSQVFRLTYKRPIIRRYDTKEKLYMCYTLCSFCIIYGGISNYIS